MAQQKRAMPQRLFPSASSQISRARFFQAWGTENHYSPCCCGILSCSLIESTYLCVTNGHNASKCRAKVPVECMWKRYVQTGIFAIPLETGPAVAGICHQKTVISLSFPRQSLFCCPVTPVCLGELLSWHRQRLPPSHLCGHLRLQLLPLLPQETADAF